MKNKKILILVISALALSTVTFVLASENSVFRRFGELTGEQISDGRRLNSEVVIKANDFSLSSNYVENLTAQNELTGKDNSEAKDMALSQIIVKRSLYYHAISEGFVVDDAAIQNSISKNREMMKEADNYEDYESFLAGLGMTEDEYWEQQYDLFKLNYVVAEFKESVKKQFVEDNSENLNAQELNEKAGKNFMDLVETAVSMQDMQLSGGLSWKFSRSDDYIIALCS